MAQMSNYQGPLAGVNVIDFGHYYAGPIAGVLLADQGANVIRIVKPSKPELREQQYRLLNRKGFPGKRSILTDVKTAPGRQVFDKLISWSDVVVHNSLDDTAIRLGVTHDQLRKINSGVVSCQMSGFGGTYRNGWEWRAGVEPVLQGASGLMAQSGTLETPLWHGIVAAADCIGGLGLAFASLLGVYQRLITGHSQEVRTSLARATNHYQLPNMIAKNGSSDWGEVNGQFALGQNFWQRLYACHDGWIFVGTREDKSEKLMRVVIGQDIADEKLLEMTFIQHDCEYWQAKLQAAEIGCHQVLSVDDICKTSTISVNNNTMDELAGGSTEVLSWDNHPCGHPISFLSPNYVRIGENNSYKRVPPFPRLGGHTKEILSELGYSESEIVELLRIKVVHKYLPALGSEDVYFIESKGK